MCYICRMTEIAARELRNRTADVLRRVEAGEQVTITSRGRPVAQLTPVRAARRRPIARAELTRRLVRTQADPGLREDLAVLAGDTTDNLGPIR
jgi:prevent-host-death family protein